MPGQITNRLDRTRSVGDDDGVAEIALLEEHRYVIRKRIQVIASIRGFGAAVTTAVDRHTAEAS
jgi:hypothetical protein